jgi:lipid II:glycine glycyltransferase (peptidoglycan interpeptide bridge formation enzyme)
MFTEGVALLARTVGPDGDVRATNIVYLTDTHAYYLHGTHDPAARDPAGHLLHWETMKHVNGLGRRWYDFGIVPSLDPDDGLFKFKRSFGGEFLASGREYRHANRWMERGVEALRRLRERVRRLER